MSKRGGTVGLITGCFDVLHIGHVRHFKWAKKRVDLLVVGLESDRSVSLSKGVGRPVFKQSIRAEVISELVCIDYAFNIRKVCKFNSPSNPKYYDALIKHINPDYLITHATKDASVANKRVITGRYRINLLLRRENPMSSSTEIVEKIKLLD